jgi:hypothetical protein
MKTKIDVKKVLANKERKGSKKYGSFDQALLGLGIKSKTGK